jgi:ABC-type Fe3+ transport system permease subunit
VLGLALGLLPLAALLQLGMRVTQDHTGLHAASLLHARRVHWSLSGRSKVIGVMLLFVLAYADFTVNALLAPPQFTSVTIRLLNLLHYGRSPMLLAMFVVAFAVPVMVALLTMLAARFYSHRLAR